MLIIHNLTYWFILSSSATLLFPFMLLTLPFQGGAHKMAQVRVHILDQSLKYIISLNYTLGGVENVPDHLTIICAKHQDGWETLVLQEVFLPQAYVAKHGPSKIPFFDWGLKLAKTISIDRNNSRKANRQLIEQGLTHKDEGYWIIIFPEGTHLPPGKGGRYKPGGVCMTKMFEMDIVPVALNSGEFWSRNPFLKYPGTISVIISRPIAYSSDDGAELMARCEQWIESQQPLITGQGPLVP